MACVRLVRFWLFGIRFRSLGARAAVLPAPLSPQNSLVRPWLQLRGLLLYRLLHLLQRSTGTVSPARAAKAPPVSLLARCDIQHARTHQMNSTIWPGDSLEIVANHPSAHFHWLRSTPLKIKTCLPRSLFCTYRKPAWFSSTSTTRSSWRARSQTLVIMDCKPLVFMP